MKTREENIEYRILCTFMATYFADYLLFLGLFFVVNGTMDPNETKQTGLLRPERCNPKFLNFSC